MCSSTDEVAFKIKYGAVHFMYLSISALDLRLKQCEGRRLPYASCAPGSRVHQAHAITQHKIDFTVLLVLSPID